MKLTTKQPSVIRPKPLKQNPEAPVPVTRMTKPDTEVEFLPRTQPETQPETERMQEKSPIQTGSPETLQESPVEVEMAMSGPLIQLRTSLNQLAEVNSVSTRPATEDMTKNTVVSCPTPRSPIKDKGKLKVKQQKSVITQEPQVIYTKALGTSPSAKRQLKSKTKQSQQKTPEKQNPTQYESQSPPIEPAVEPFGGTKAPNPTKEIYINNPPTEQHTLAIDSASPLLDHSKGHYSQSLTKSASLALLKQQQVNKIFKKTIKPTHKRAPKQNHKLKKPAPKHPKDKAPLSFPPELLNNISLQKPVLKQRPKPSRKRVISPAFPLRSSFHLRQPQSSAWQTESPSSSARASSVDDDSPVLRKPKISNFTNLLHYELKHLSQFNPSPQQLAPEITVFSSEESESVETAQDVDFELAALFKGKHWARTHFSFSPQVNLQFPQQFDTGDGTLFNEDEVNTYNIDQRVFESIMMKKKFFEIRKFIYKQEDYTGENTDTLCIIDTHLKHPEELRVQRKFEFDQKRRRERALRKRKETLLVKLGGKPKMTLTNLEEEYYRSRGKTTRKTLENSALELNQDPDERVYSLLKGSPLANTDRGARGVPSLEREVKRLYNVLRN